VLETMRALPVDVVAGAPAFLRGVAIVRGAPTPVVDLGALVGQRAEVGRFVTISTGGACVALAVEEVLGLTTWTRAEHAEAPPLLRDAVDHVLEAMTALDEALVFVLSACAIAERATAVVAASRAT
jgi:purine-binding chemotaxis protein CheW